MWRTENQDTKKINVNENRAIKLFLSHGRAHLILKLFFDGVFMSFDLLLTPCDVFQLRLHYSVVGAALIYRRFAAAGVFLSHNGLY